MMTLRRVVSFTYYVFLRIVYPMVPGSLDCPFRLPLPYSLNVYLYMWHFLFTPLESSLFFIIGIYPKKVNFMVLILYF